MPEQLQRAMAAEAEAAREARAKVEMMMIVALEGGDVVGVDGDDGDDGGDVGDTCDDGGGRDKEGGC